MQRGGEDRISSLPDEVREHILEFLPLRDAGKASILSSKWRNLWMYLPTLVFDEKFSSKNKTDVNKVMLHICTLLFLRRGPLKEVSLSLSVLKSFPDQLDQILLFLQDEHIESLMIKDKGYGQYQKYKLSRRLFSSSFSQLKSLCLSSCQLTSSPNSFKDFVMLTVLELKSVVRIGYPYWSFRCPLLSSLTVDNCGGREHRWVPVIVIEAPKLGSFHFVGRFRYIHFKHTTFLNKATLNRKDSWLHTTGKLGLLNIWEGLAAVESLSVSSQFCEYLAGGIEHANDLCMWEMLRHMNFHDVCWSRQSLINTVLLMITSSPNLQQLEITMDISQTSASTISFNGPSKFELSRLTKVKVKNLKGTEHWLALIKWLLKSSPALDIMKIKLPAELSDAERIFILTELNGYARASTRAQIKVKSLNQKNCYAT